MRIENSARSVLIVATLAFLAAGATSAKTASALQSALEAGWSGESVCELLHQTESYRVLRCTFPPGVGHERHFHPAHFGYAVSGGTMRLEDASGTRTAEIKAGSSFSSDGVAWHEAVNIGQTTVTYIMVEEF